MAGLPQSGLAAAAPFLLHTLHVARFPKSAGTTSNHTGGKLLHPGLHQRTDGDNLPAPNPHLWCK